MSWRNSPLVGCIATLKGFQHALGLHIRMLDALSHLWLVKIDVHRQVGPIEGYEGDDLLSGLPRNDMETPEMDSRARKGDRPSVVRRKATYYSHLRGTAASFWTKAAPPVGGPGEETLHRPFSPLHTSWRGVHTVPFAPKRAATSGEADEDDGLRGNPANPKPSALPSKANSPPLPLTRRCPRARGRLRGRATPPSFPPSTDPLFLPPLPPNSHEKGGGGVDEETRQLLAAVAGRRTTSRRNNRTSKRRAFTEGEGEEAAVSIKGLAGRAKPPRGGKPPKGKSAIGHAVVAAEVKSSVSSSRPRAAPLVTPSSLSKPPPAGHIAQLQQRQREVAALARLPKTTLQARIARKRVFIQQRRQQRALLKEIQFSKALPTAQDGGKPNARPRSAEAIAPDSEAKAKRNKGAFPASNSGAPVEVCSPLHFPDYREQVLLIFQQLAEINLALGEKYKTQSYQTAMERLKREDTIFKLLPPHLKPLPENAIAIGDAAEVKELLEKRTFALDASRPIPGVGDKLRRKIVEILTTGDLEELHTLQAKPVIRAIRQLTQVHGFGPRTAVSFYKEYGINTVEELKAYAEEHGLMNESESGEGEGGKKDRNKGRFHLTDAQRFGLKYYNDIQQRIPYNECRLHEAFLKLRLRKHLGREYELTVCGSYRRKVATSGDIDVLITRRNGLQGDADPLEASQNALASFTAALQAERYVEATLAQGPTKFMGVCRLRSLKKPSGAAEEAPTRRFHARRIDIRFVDAASYPAALLYFTGSKNFNVIMRAEAIKKNFILNEYGLFRNNSSNAAGTGRLHEMIGMLSKAQYYTSKKGALNYSLSHSSTADEDPDGGGAPAATTKRGRRGAAKAAAGKMQAEELLQVLHEVEALRVRVQSEKDIFDAIGMSYVEPQNRNV